MRQSFDEKEVIKLCHKTAMELSREANVERTGCVGFNARTRLVSSEIVQNAFRYLAERSR